MPLLETARRLDELDPLKHTRTLFHYPKDEEGLDKLYFLANSLGLMPKMAAASVQSVLRSWEELAVAGWFTEPDAWMSYETRVLEPMASLVGATTQEIAILNSLSVNLNLALASFYQPEGLKKKIAIEQHAFPSDVYAVKSQLDFHGYSPDSDLIRIESISGASTLTNEDIERTLTDNASDIKTVLIGGVNYYTGQAFDIQGVTKLAHDLGLTIGWDLAHAVGNIPLKLHEWDVDFAVWCTYKYLSGGPGAPGGLFIHEKFNDTPLPRFAGWWGNEEETRFLMRDEMVPTVGARGWQMSATSPFHLAMLDTSLDIFMATGMENIRKKSLEQSRFLMKAIDDLSSDQVSILTPREDEQHGSQISIQTHGNGKAIFEKLQAAGVICDWREPDVIRVAPFPLYNTFSELAEFVAILQRAL